MSSNDLEAAKVQGLPGSEGLIVGPLLVIDEKERIVHPEKISASDIDRHQQLFINARTLYLAELDDLLSNLDKQTSEIIEAQKHIVADQEIEIMINKMIGDDQYCVDYAIYKTFNGFIERLKESGSDLFRQRIIDLENIRDRLVALSCDEQEHLEVEKGAILVVREISPTDLVTYHERGVKGLVMDKGGVTSHAALIARSLNIPCLVSAKHAVHSARDAKTGILDANKGELILDPSADVVKSIKKAIKAEKKRLQSERKKKERSETLDGFPFHLRANIEFPQELDLANQNGGEGVGLLRTEALLYGGMANKSESEQDAFLKKILTGIQGPVTIRLFDVGGDKLNVHTPDEDNPFLGWRGIRMLLDEKDMFCSQLRSILKCAGKYPGRIKILVPMVSLVEEVIEVRNAVEQVQQKLLEEGIPIDEQVPVGMMIEVPSAALLADKFAREVDFFSIGTNDLTQYSLAVDRGNERICNIYQHYHPAVWKLIKMSVDAAIKNEIEVSVCGELAGDPIGAPCLLGLGVTDLSMAPSSIPKVKKILTQYPLDRLKKYAMDVLESTSGKEVQILYDELSGG